jgi:hypothetical protein
MDQSNAPSPPGATAPRPAEKQVESTLPPPKPPAETHHHSGGKKLKLIIGGIVAIVVLIAGSKWIIEVLNTVSTDDAYVNGHVTFVAPRVPGQVLRQCWWTTTTACARATCSPQLDQGAVPGASSPIEAGGRRYRRAGGPGQAAHGRRPRHLIAESKRSARLELWIAPWRTWTTRSRLLRARVAAVESEQGRASPLAQARVTIAPRKLVACRRRCVARGF